jgi:signal peptidase I
MAVLESGHSVELPATGYSMFPTLRPGDRVVVKPLAKGELPLTGSVMVCMDNGAKAQRRKGATVQRHNDITPEQHNSMLVMHRLIKIIVGNDGEPMFITRGDSGIEKDKPWLLQQLAGIALTYTRDDKEHFIGSYIPGVCRYKYNQRLLWLHNLIKR